MQGVRDAAARIATIGGTALGFVPQFRALTPSPQSDAPVVAVDGSAAVIADNGAVWAVAVRAEALAWPGPRPPEPQPEVAAGTPSEAAAILEVAYAAAGFDAPRLAGADAWATALQALAEWRAAVAALAQRPRLLLVDGALRGLPRAAQALADALAQRASDAGVSVVGVAKRSGIGGALVPRLQEAGPAGAWVCDVPGEPGVRVARLHAAATHAFRVDADRDADIAALLPLCRDAAYLGYPYPLALVHNRVALTSGRVAEIKGSLERELRGQGRAATAVAADFHDVLDRNVPG